MLNERFFEARIVSDDEETKDVFVKTEEAVEFGKLIRGKTEVREPIDAATMVLDRISEFAIIPQTANANDAVELFDGFSDKARDILWITGIGVGIQNEQAFVEVFFIQGIAPKFFAVFVTSKTVFVDVDDCVSMRRTTHGRNLGSGIDRRLFGIDCKTPSKGHNNEIEQSINDRTKDV